MTARRSYSLTEVAEQVLPPEWKRPELWLQRRLRRGEISGVKLGNTWRMTDADIDAMLARYHNGARTPEPAQPRQLSFTRTSARRLRAVGS